MRDGGSRNRKRKRELIGGLWVPLASLPCHLLTAVRNPYLGSRLLGGPLIFEGFNQLTGNSTDHAPKMFNPWIRGVPLRWT